MNKLKKEFYELKAKFAELGGVAIVLEELKEMAESHNFPDPFRMDLLVGCFVNEIEKLQIDNEVLKGCIQTGLKPDELKGAYLALKQMKAKGKSTI